MIRILRTPLARSIGAMFRKSLDNEILVFAYKKPGRKTFHTYFCPPLHIIALDSDGQVVFAQTVARGQLVRLPVSTRVVIETAPDTDLDTEIVWNVVNCR